jgi:hypothetical protein
MIKEKSKAHVQKLPIEIHKKIIQLAKIDIEGEYYVLHWPSSGKGWSPTASFVPVI